MASELGIAAALGAVLLRGLASEGRRPVLIVAAIAVAPSVAWRPAATPANALLLRRGAIGGHRA